ncbi:MAG TPA: pitrilysin family protein [Candidatus Angelobacter sp.]|nr:pitrilysin family protein [Candidatus Angelobacter sp.]
MLKKSIALLILIAAGLASSFAQPGAPGDNKQLPSKVERLNRAPVSNEVIKAKLPRPMEMRLPNGLTLLVIEQHRLPTVQYSLWFKSGSIADPADMPGLASFTADLLREGTARRTSTQIAAELDEIGASFNADAAFGENLTTVDASGLSQSADKLMELMSDIVLNASFPADELKKYSQREKASLIQLRSDPAFLARERFARAVYGDFPAAVQAPTAESLTRATPELLKDFHDKHYTPGNAILAVAGDLTQAQATALAKKYFGAWKDHPVPALKTGDLPAPAKARIFLVDRPDSVQSNIVAGNLSLRRKDPDFIPLTLTNRILGGGPAGRLFINLREEKGYTYGAYSRLTSHDFPGTLAANTEVRNAVTDGSLHELMYEFKRLRDEKVPQSELDEAKRSIIASFALSLENLGGIVNRWMAVKYYGLPLDYWDKYPDEVAKLNADDVQRTARKYIDLDHLQLVVVGDAKQVREAVEKYGSVQMFDADGKPIAPRPQPEAAAPGTK